MDIIGHLSRTVTPAVLGDNRDSRSESLLEQFYAIFAGRLADNDTYGRFDGRQIAGDDHDFYNQVWTDNTHRSNLSRELASTHGVEESSVHGMVAAAAPLAYNEINSLSGSTPVPQFLRDNLDTYRNHIPAWAGTMLPAGLLVAEPAGQRISDTTSTAPLVKEEEKSGSFLKALLPIIGLLILAALAWALLRGCQDDPEAATTPVVAAEEQVAEEGAVAPTVAAAELPSLRMATGEDNMLYACRINAGDEALSNQIVDAMRNVFGDEAAKCRSDIDDSFGSDMMAAPYLADILPIVQQSPNASMIIKGDTIAVNAPDQAVLDALVADLQAAAPDMKVVAEGPLDLQGEIDNSLAAAGAAIDNLGGEGDIDPRDVARALSLQVINFELDKAFIPDVNKPLLDRAAKMIQETPNTQLVIIGHTDSQASDAYNMELSQDRAKSVRDYLVSQGVDTDKLAVKGMGESDPIATNETEQGRFRNRRIEFTVYDESMGEIGEDGIIVAPDSEFMSGGMDSNMGAGASTVDMVDPDLNPLDNNNDDVLPDGDDPLNDFDPDLNPLDNNNDDVLPDGDDTILGNQ